MSDTISIIIPAYNNANLTLDCLKGLIQTHSIYFETLLIDDGSKDPIYKVLSRMFPRVQVLHNETNQGFVRSVNRGIQAAKGTYILLLNNDTHISDSLWLRKLYDGMVKRKLDMAGVVGGRLNEKTWTYIPGEAKRATDKFQFLPFWCCLIRREVFDTVGLLDERFGLGFFDDVDLYYRAKKAGFKGGIVENIGIRHLYHSTFKSIGCNINAQYHNNREIFMEKMREARV